MKCPKCDAELDYQATWDDRDIYDCPECLATWSIDTNNSEDVQRYFFG